VWFLCRSSLELIIALRKMNDVDATMARIAEQREIANEISEAISAPIDQLDEVFTTLEQVLQALTTPHRMNYGMN
jgi:prefoldin subunit 5